MTTAGQRRMWHAAEQRRQQNQREEAEHCRHEVRELAAGAGGHSHGSLGQAADDEEPAEQPA